MRGFVVPASVPVKKTPDITDIIEVRDAGYEVRGTSNLEPRTSNLEPRTSHLAPPTSHPVPRTPLPEFSSSWRSMFEQVFASVPTIYFSLKESLPEIENNIIKVVVKNVIQKEHFEAKTREVLEFLRTHYDERIEDIVVETNELLETKKIIYDVKDKLQNFKEQNEEFEEFLQILDLKIKD